MDAGKWIDGVGATADHAEAEPVSVAVSKQDTEVPVVGQERWEEIQRMYREGLRIAEIAR